MLDTGHQVLQFWADESVASIGGVHMKPDLLKKFPWGKSSIMTELPAECNTTSHSPPDTFYKPGRFL